MRTFISHCNCSQLLDSTLLVMQPNGSFSTTLTPLLSNIPVPDFSGPIFNYTFTGAEPVGNYTWFAALTIARLYRYRWQVELFFKWIKQHLRIKAFFGTTENAVKTLVWIAVSVCVLVAIIKKRLKLEASLYTILQILSVTLFERMSLYQALTDQENTVQECVMRNQLNLFDKTLGY